MRSFVSQKEYADPLVEQPTLTGLEKWALMKAHPKKIAIDLAGLAWGVYFLWQHQWENALLVTLMVNAFTAWLVSDIDFEQMAQTLMGRMALLHLQPFNIITQTIGVFTALYGVWLHTSETVLIGISFLAIGHATGWSEVDTRFAPKK